MRKQLLKAGKPGPAGAKGDTGATGATGSTGQGATVQGSAPQKGDTGPAGKDGANPATLVANSGDADWKLSGGDTSANNPSAALTGGWLHLKGGFDSSTPAGAIGIAHAYNNLPLSSLKTLSYDFRVTKRPDGSVQAPTIHVFVTGVNTTDGKTFTNFVFEPYVQGNVDLNQVYSMDAMQGKWWSTHPTGDISQGTPASWAHVVQVNPNAKIGSISLDNGGLGRRTRSRARTSRPTRTT